MGDVISREDAEIFAEREGLLLLDKRRLHDLLIEGLAVFLDSAEKSEAGEIAPTFEQTINRYLGRAWDSPTIAPHINGKAQIEMNIFRARVQAGAAMIMGEIVEPRKQQRPDESRRQ